MLGAFNQIEETDEVFNEEPVDIKKKWESAYGRFKAIFCYATTWTNLDVQANTVVFTVDKSCMKEWFRGYAYVQDTQTYSPQRAIHQRIPCPCGKPLCVCKGKGSGAKYYFILYFKKELLEAWGAADNQQENQYVVEDLFRQVLAQEQCDPNLLKELLDYYITMGLIYYGTYDKEKAAGYFSKVASLREKANSLEAPAMKDEILESTECFVKLSEQYQNVEDVIDANIRDFKAYYSYFYNSVVTWKSAGFCIVNGKFVSPLDENYFSAMMRHLMDTLNIATTCVMNPCLTKIFSNLASIEGKLREGSEVMSEITEIEKVVLEVEKNRYKLELQASANSFDLFRIYELDLLNHLSDPHSLLTKFKDSELLIQFLEYYIVHLIIHLDMGNIASATASCQKMHIVLEKLKYFFGENERNQLIEDKCGLIERLERDLKRKVVQFEEREAKKKLLEVYERHQRSIEQEKKENKPIEKKVKKPQKVVKQDPAQAEREVRKLLQDLSLDEKKIVEIKKKKNPESVISEELKRAQREKASEERKKREEEASKIQAIKEKEKQKRKKNGITPLQREMAKCDLKVLRMEQAEKKEEEEEANKEANENEQKTSFKVQPFYQLEAIMELPDSIRELMLSLENWEKRGYQIYLAGGMVREWRMGRPYSDLKDIDLFTNMPSDTLASFLKEKYPIWVSKEEYIQGLFSGSLKVGGKKKSAQITSLEFNKLEDFVNRANDFSFNMNACDKEGRVFFSLQGNGDFCSKIIARVDAGECMPPKNVMRALIFYFRYKNQDFRFSSATLKKIKKGSKNLLGGLAFPVYRNYLRGLFLADLDQFENIVLFLQESEILPYLLTSNEKRVIAYGKPKFSFNVKLLQKNNEYDVLWFLLSYFEAPEQAITEFAAYFKEDEVLILKNLKIRKEEGKKDSCSNAEVLRSYQPAKGFFSPPSVERKKNTLLK